MLTGSWAVILVAADGDVFGAKISRSFRLDQVIRGFSMGRPAWDADGDYEGTITYAGAEFALKGPVTLNDKKSRSEHITLGVCFEVGGQVAARMTYQRVGRYLSKLTTVAYYQGSYASSDRPEFLDAIAKAVSKDHERRDEDERDRMTEAALETSDANDGRRSRPSLLAS